MPSSSTPSDGECGGGSENRPNPAGRQTSAARDVDLNFQSRTRGRTHQLNTQRAVMLLAKLDDPRLARDGRLVRMMREEMRKVGRHRFIGGQASVKEIAEWVRCADDKQVVPLHLLAGGLRPTFAHPPAAAAATTCGSRNWA